MARRLRGVAQHGASWRTGAFVPVQTRANCRTLSQKEAGERGTQTWSTAPRYTQALTRSRASILREPILRMGEGEGMVRRARGGKRARGARRVSTGHVCPERVGRAEAPPCRHQIVAVAISARR